MLIVVATSLCLFFLTRNVQGITDGTYKRCDENGVITEIYPAEYSWSIWRGSATYLYTKYDIKLIDNTICFEYIAQDPKYSKTFEVEYNKETKFLTIFLPSDFTYAGASAVSEEIIAFYFVI